ncbi:MAG: DUF2279 domain-containing protein, partial [Chitinophagaceae bacterium]|nr:DUF2279 domain-containing protein [Chitinophagaceae bacterium]
MRSSALLLSSSLASHSSSSRSLLGILLLSFLFPTIICAQTDTLKTDRTDSVKIDTPFKVDYPFSSGGASHNLMALYKYQSSDPYYYSLTPQQKKKRIWLVGGANVVGYGGTMVALSAAWYKDYPKSKLHSFNDMAEWKQVDKVGHLYSAYIESRASMELWRWTGIDRKKRIWIGGMSGAFYQTAIEVLDGYSAEWGWSWGDFGANILGSGVLVAQELAWNDQRIKLKFSFHR